MAEDNMILTRRVKRQCINPPVKINLEATPPARHQALEIATLLLLRSPSMVFQEGSGCQTVRVGSGEVIGHRAPGLTGLDRDFVYLVLYYYYILVH
jgi:hypothetical protein